MLRAIDLHYAYPAQDETLTGLSAVVSVGITLLTGPNAGGKTTFLRLLAGLLEPARGVIARLGGDTPVSARELRNTGRMVMQDPDPQILGAYVGEDITLGKSASGLGAAFSERAGELAEKFDLKRFWHAPVSALSYGQKKKLCLLHALLAGTGMLLLDEPFAGLDYPAARELRTFIRENRKAGLAQVICTHELEPVFDLADWMVVIVSGRAAAEGRPEELRGRLGQWSVRAPGQGWD